MLQDSTKDKKLSITVLIVLGSIVLFNTVVLIIVGFKILDMEETQSEARTEAAEQLSKPRDLKLLKQEFRELEKSSLKQEEAKKSNTKSDTIKNNQSK